MKTKTSKKPAIVAGIALALTGCSSAPTTPASGARGELATFAAIAPQGLHFMFGNGQSVAVSFDGMGCTDARTACTAALPSPPSAASDKLPVCSLSGTTVTCALASVETSGNVTITPDHAFVAHLVAAGGMLDLQGSFTLEQASGSWRFHGTGDCVCDGSGTFQAGPK